MKLVDGLPPTQFDLDRGNGPESIPSTGGKPSDPFYSKPATACFWRKDKILETASLAYEPGKIFLGRVDNKMIGVADNRHVVTIAGSRGGKSACLLIPNLLLYDGSALVLDPKGELARETAHHRAEQLGQDVIVIDPWGVSGQPSKSYNPIDDLMTGDPDDLIDDADLLADALVIGNDREPHWTDSARALIRAMILWIALDPSFRADGRGPTLAQLPPLLAMMAERAADTEALPSLFPVMAEFEAPQALEAQRVINTQGMIMTGGSPTERASILSTARTQLAFLESPQLERAISSGGVTLAALKRRPTTIYLCLPAARMGTHSRWLRLMVNLAVAMMEREPQTQKRPVLFILEEFAALGHMRALETAAAYMAGYGVKLWTVLQDITQLKRHYADSWETFLGNAGVLQAFSVVDMTTSEYLSKRLGNTTIVIRNREEISADAYMKGGTGTRMEFRTQALMELDEVSIHFAHKRDAEGRSIGGRSLVLVSGARAFIVDRVFWGELE